MNKNESDLVIKAISNKKRLEILSYIHKERLLIKNDLLQHFELQRAGLDFHLSALEEAGLIGLKDIKIKGRKNVFIYPKAKWKIFLEPIELNHLNELLPMEITSTEDFQGVLEHFWTDSEILENQQIAKKILGTFITKIGDLGGLITCYRCRNEPGIMKCVECSNFYCISCAEIIHRQADNLKVILCYDCISNQFS